MAPELVGTEWSGRGAVAGGCGGTPGICDPTSSSNGAPGLEVPRGDGAAGRAVRGSSSAFLLVGGLGSSTVTLGPAGGLLPFRGWLRSTSAWHVQDPSFREVRPAPWSLRTQDDLGNVRGSLNTPIPPLLKSSWGPETDSSCPSPSEGGRAVQDPSPRRPLPLGKVSRMDCSRAYLSRL